MREKRVVRPDVGRGRCGGGSGPSPSVVLQRAADGGDERAPCPDGCARHGVADYEICWAYDGTEELAGYVGAQLPPARWDRQPTLKLARGRKHLCHLISVVDADGQLRFWQLWWYLSKAWPGPALWGKMSGRGIRRIRLGKIPEGGAHIDVRRKTLGRGKPPTQWASFRLCPSCGPGGRPRSGRTASRSTSADATALSAFPNWTWSRASTVPRRGSASGYSRNSKTARPGISPNSRVCWRLSHPGSRSAPMP